MYFVGIIGILRQALPNQISFLCSTYLRDNFCTVKIEISEFKKKTISIGHAGSLNPPNPDPLEARPVQSRTRPKPDPLKVRPAQTCWKPDLPKAGPAQS